MTGALKAALEKGGWERWYGKGKMAMERGEEGERGVFFLKAKKDRTTAVHGRSCGE